MKMQEQVVGFQLSLQQRRLWHAQQENAAFRAQCVVAIRGRLSVKTLREALRRVVRRHEILRTTFCYLPGIKTPVQVINDDAPYAWGVGDLSDARDESALEQLCERERETAFDPERGPVLRALLVKGGARRLLILTLPALCADARTLTNLAGELARAYSAASRGGEDDDEVVQYLQFSEWQNELLEEEEAADGREFWRRLADGHAPPLPFERNPADASAPYRPSRVALALDPDLSAHVREAARGCGAPPDTFLLAAWQTLLWRLSGQPHVVVRAMFEGRKFEELSGALGLFAKWPPVAQRFERGRSFREVVARVQEAAHENHAWLEYFTGEGEGGVGEGAPEESASGAGVGFEFSAWPEAFAAGGVSFALERQYACCERFKLNLSCVESGGALAAQFYYDPARLSRAEVERLADEFRVLLGSAARAPDSPAGQLDVLGDAESARLLFEFNRTESPAPPAPCAHMLFERQAESTPGRVAAADASGRSLTYAELNARANQLARHLRRLGVGREVPVALFVERGLEMVVALLGVLKAGGAYVPLDPSYPRERLAYMLTDSQARFILTKERLAGALPEDAPQALRLDADWPEVGRESAENPDHAVGPDNLAYVIYTSGSTGVPKGVMVTHGGLANYLHWARSAYIREESQFGAPVHSPVGFDLTVTSLFCPLLAGQAVELIAEEEGVEGLSAAMRRHDFSLVKLTPAHLDLLARSIPAEEAAGAGRALVIGGEALSGDSLAFWREHAPRTRLINEYGPTETVVGCCVHEVAAGEAPAGAVPIGRPIANTRLYALDAGGRPAPAGAPGELYVGGAGVARGYLGRPALTAERFVPDPFSGEAGGRLYRTGDVGRVRGDGVFEFLGRNDEQVKVRGFRVEPGEVEAVLKAHPSVGEAAVISHEDGPGERRLVAYVVMGAGGPGDAPNVGELRRWVGEKLPDYMVPSIFVTLKQLPLTAHGKVDRRRLPAPDRSRPELEQEYVAPSTPVEQVLAAIWTEVLGIEQIGVHDSFFALGGDSIRSVRIVALARERGLDFSVQQLFQFQTIAEMARELERAAGLAEPGGAEEAGRDDEEEMARLLEELEGISEEDVKTILRERLGAAEPGT